MADAIEKLARAVLQRSPDVAHDLKTPLNIVVLNVELLRMRLRTIAADVAKDPKVAESCRSIDREVHRIASIVDSFLSIAQMPEKDVPVLLDAAAVICAALREKAFMTEQIDPHMIATYPSRMEKAAKLLAKGLSSVIDPSESSVQGSHQEGRLSLHVSGPCPDERVELGKLFKFYYTGPSGEADLSLASARLLFETLGGSIEMEHSERTAQFRIELQGDE